MKYLLDEEIGGVEGMKKFVNTDEFQRLNIGFALDEGLASPNEEYALNYGERCIWRECLKQSFSPQFAFETGISDLHIHVTGQPGHGSLLLDNTPGEKVAYILNKFYEFRRGEQQKLKDNPTLNVGDVTTVNLTQIHVREARLLSFFVFALTYFFSRPARI